MSVRKLTTLMGTLQLLLACQTIPDSPVEVPAPEAANFVPCSPLDGAVKLDLLNDGELLGSAEMEWIAEEPGQFIAQIVNPFGQPVLRLEEQGDKVDASGELADRVPDLTFNGDGFLTVNDYFAGIHREELPCILAAKLPARWLVYVYSVEQMDDRLRVLAYDGERSIKVSMRKAPSSKTCTWVRWRRFAGLVSRGYKWCIDEQTPSRSRISGIDTYELKWVSLDG